MNPELKQQIVQQLSSWYYKHQTPFNTKTRNNYIEAIMMGRKLIRKICNQKKKIYMEHIQTKQDFYQPPLFNVSLQFLEY